MRAKKKKGGGRRNKKGPGRGTNRFYAGHLNR
jgi:hypothetical protein